MEELDDFGADIALGLENNVSISSSQNRLKRQLNLLGLKSIDACTKATGVENRPYAGIPKSPYAEVASNLNTIPKYF